MKGESKYHGPLPGLMGVKDPGFRPAAIADGDRIQVGTRTIEVFAVPGHTIGSAAYLVDDVAPLPRARIERPNDQEDGVRAHGVGVERRAARVVRSMKKEVLARIRLHAQHPVSYTHLTLPTSD